MSPTHRFFATCPKGVEPILRDEAREIGLPHVRGDRGGVRFEGELADGLWAVLWLRTAQRVLLELARFPAAGADALYAGTRELPWEEHLSTSSTFAIDALGTSPELRHTHFTALKVKDAIADRLRQRFGARPDVDPNNPDVRIVAHLGGGHCTLSLDLAGTSLHRRGYRQQTGEAPIKESLAAAIVRWTGWDRHSPLVDPMCGTGTIAIEAALWAMVRAPGRDLLPAALRWPAVGDEAARLWRDVCEQADEREHQRCPAVVGASDIDPRAVAATEANVRAAGLGRHVRVERADAFDLKLPPGPGLLIANPPYGERMGGESGEVEALLRRFGEAVRRYEGYRVVVFSARMDAPELMDLRPRAVHQLFNGPIECGLFDFG